MEVKSSSAEAVSVRVEASLFSDEAAMRAAHRVTDRFFVNFERDGSRLVVQFKSRGDRFDVKALEGEYANLLLDEELRERIAKETEAERTLIMAHALSRQPLIVAAEV